MTWTSTTIRFVKIDGAWVRFDQIQAVSRIQDVGHEDYGRTRVDLVGGNHILVGDRTITPDDVMDQIQETP